MENWALNHFNANLSIAQAEASRALWFTDVDFRIKDVIAEKWQESLMRHHGLDTFRLPWWGCLSIKLCLWVTTCYNKIHIVAF